METVQYHNNEHHFFCIILIVKASAGISFRSVSITIGFQESIRNDWLAWNQKLLSLLWLLMPDIGQILNAKCNQSRKIYWSVVVKQMLFGLPNFPYNLTLVYHDSPSNWSMLFNWTGLSTKYCQWTYHYCHCFWLVNLELLWLV